MFITKKVFDPALEGKAVYLTTDKFDTTGFYVVSYVDNEDLHLVDHTAIITKYHVSFFDIDGNNMQVLEIPGPKLKPLFNQISIMETLPEIEIIKPHKTGFNRNFESRQHRTEKQIRKENAEIEQMLRENIEPMKLEDILRRMRQLGYILWNNNNASGFVKYAIKQGMNIVKVKTGVYSYHWGGQD